MNIGILAVIIALILLAIGAAGETRQGRTEKHIDVNRAAYNCPITLKEIHINGAGGRT